MWFPHVSSCQASIILIKPAHHSMKHTISVPEPEGTDEPVSPLNVLELDVFARWTPCLSAREGLMRVFVLRMDLRPCNRLHRLHCSYGKHPQSNGNDNACLSPFASDRCKLPGCCIRESPCTRISIGGKQGGVGFVGVSPIYGNDTKRIMWLIKLWVSLSDCFDRWLSTLIGSDSFEVETFHSFREPGNSLKMITQ